MIFHLNINGSNISKLNGLSNIYLGVDKMRTGNRLADSDSDGRTRTGGRGLAGRANANWHLNIFHYHIRNLELLHIVEE